MIILYKKITDKTLNQTLKADFDSGRATSCMLKIWVLNAIQTT